MATLVLDGAPGGCAAVPATEDDAGAGVVVEEGGLVASGELACTGGAGDAAGTRVAGGGGEAGVAATGAGACVGGIAAAGGGGAGAGGCLSITQPCPTMKARTPEAQIETREEKRIIEHTFRRILRFTALAATTGQRPVV